MREVQLINEAEMNLLGLILKAILERNLERPVAARLSRRMNSVIHIQAGEMKVTVRLQEGGITIRRGWEGRASATVVGSLKAFMDLATMSSVVRPLLQRQVKIGGNPLVLARIFPLLMV